MTDSAVLQKHDVCQIHGVPLTDWIDRELSGNHMHKSVDVLLEWRQALIDFQGNTIDAAQFVKTFFELRKAAGDTSYLLFYRFRRWIDANFCLVVSDPLSRIPEEKIPLPLDSNDLGHGISRIRQRVFEMSEADFSPADLRLSIIPRL